MLSPIDIEVIRNALSAAAAEMDVTVWRTSRSTIVRELLDYSTAVFDADGWNLAQSARIPQHLNSMSAALRTLLEKFVVAEDWGPDDVVITNDPYCGGQHLPDIVAFRPVFHAGVRIAYVDLAPTTEDRGEPILLIHGFASNHAVNWVNTMWVRTLNHAGRRVIALDNRGHGQSEKLYEPGLYATSLMARDAVNLLDHLEIERADVMGYSMGARIAAFMAIEHRARLRKAILGGLGDRLVNGAALPGNIAQAMEAADHHLRGLGILHQLIGIQRAVRDRGEAWDCRAERRRDGLVA
jgi:predicted alpha/beta-fold hydrolase